MAALSRPSWRAGLGDGWRAEWLLEVLTLPRRLLAEALDSGDAAALLDRALADAIPPGVGDALGAIAAGLANEGVRLDSAHDLESALAARPALRQKLEAALRAVVDVAAGGVVDGVASGRLARHLLVEHLERFGCCARRRLFVLR